jgi:hypothetical protein
MLYTPVMLLRALLLLPTVMSSSNTGITIIFFTPLSIPNIPQMIQPILCLVHNTGRHVELGGGVFIAQDSIRPIAFCRYLHLQLPCDRKRITYPPNACTDLAVNASVA